MKRYLITLLLLVGLAVAPTQKSHAIVWVVVKAAAKKVIKAIDLGIQKQQNKVIWLQNAQKTLENAMSKLKLDEISEWTEKQRDQYKKYFDELQQVKLVITYYQRIRDIAHKEGRVVSEYNRAWHLVSRDKNFTAKEIKYMGDVYSGILQETLKNVEQIAMIVNSFQTQMSDAKRLELINRTAERVDENYADLLEFNRENGMLSIRRTRDANSMEVIKKLYGLEF